MRYVELLVVDHERRWNRVRAAKIQAQVLLRERSNHAGERLVQ